MSAALATTSQDRPTYISSTETAKLIRHALKTRFPGQKFRVVTDKYAGGSSIRVYHNKDASDELRGELNDLICYYAGTGFDGMIDMSYYKDSWLKRKTGETKPAKSSGTTGSMGVYEPYDYPSPGDDWELVHFGASHVFVERDWSA